MSSASTLPRALEDLVAQGNFSVPAYPAVALRLQRLLARDSYGTHEVTNILAADAGLAATVLAAANSGLHGAGSPITSLSGAVNRLGARTVGSIALASGVGAVATSNGPLQDVKFRVWRRTMTCALACQKLGGARGLAPEEAFLAGLLHGFGRSVAVASMEQLLRTSQSPLPLSAEEWLGIAEQQRAPLARAVAKSWQLPQVIAEAVDTKERGSSPLNELVLDADAIAGELDAGRVPQASSPREGRWLDELLACLPAALQAFSPPATALPKQISPPSALVTKPEHALAGDLLRATLPVVDRGAKGGASLTCLALAPAGIELDSSRRYQECAIVRLLVGEANASCEPWFTVVLCAPAGSGYRVELQLFSPTVEIQQQWLALYRLAEGELCSGIIEKERPFVADAPGVVARDAGPGLRVAGIR